MKHTPGPWSHAGSIILSVGHGYICQMLEPRPGKLGRPHRSVLYIGSPDWDEAMASARLIAAAPEMYAMLVEVRDAFADSLHSADEEMVANIDAILARARGEES